MKRSLNHDNVYNENLIEFSKSILVQSMLQSSSHFHTNEEEKKLKSLLDVSFNQHRSISFVVIGDEDSGKEQVVNQVLESYRIVKRKSNIGNDNDNNSYNNDNNNNNTEEESEQRDFRIAHISGGLDNTDQLAILSLQKQLFYNADGIHNKFDINLERIENAFKSSKLACIPTVIIIHDIHEYAKNPKQLLLYTLLDMMHRNDCLFVLIGKFSVFIYYINIRVYLCIYIY